jgi:hypothetical protein
MLNPGRNDPCHCGSGKKYKKCCADRDQEKAVKELKEGLTNRIQFDVVERQSENKNFNWSDERPEDPYYKPYPAISDEEQKLVDEWWDVYRKIDSLEETRNHLGAFMDRHPHLVENLGLDVEVLFELGTQYRSEERTDEYIAFLMYFRRQFPATYVRSAGFYDLDIIAWLISKQRQSEIKHYLNYFIEEPVRLVDQLYEVIYLLLATDTTDEILPLIAQVSQRIAESETIFYSEEIIRPLVIQILSPYIKPGFTKSDVGQFLDALRNKIPFRIDVDENAVDAWSNKLQAMTRPFDRWPETVPPKPSEQERRCSDIRFNFMRHLHERLGISWMSAQYYADLIYEYLMTYPGKKKKRKSLFDFSKTTMESQLGGLIGSMDVYVDCTTFMGLLNSIYFFGAYLHECKNYSIEEMWNTQANCKSIYAEFYPEIKNQYTEALCFGEFPLYEPRSYQ